MTVAEVVKTFGTGQRWLPWFASSDSKPLHRHSAGDRRFSPSLSDGLSSLTTVTSRSHRAASGSRERLKSDRLTRNTLRRP